MVGKGILVLWVPDLWNMQAFEGKFWIMTLWRDSCLFVHKFHYKHIGKIDAFAHIFPQAPIDHILGVNGVNYCNFESKMLVFYIKKQNKTKLGKMFTAKLFPYFVHFLFYHKAKRTSKIVLLQCTLLSSGFSPGTHILILSVSVSSMCIKFLFNNLTTQMAKGH